MLVLNRPTSRPRLRANFSVCRLKRHLAASKAIYER